MKDNTIKNSLIGTCYEKNNYYLNLYDIDKNMIKKKLMSYIQFSKESINNININNKNENINNKAFCFNCKKNIDLNMSSECKAHNIKYLNDLIKEINIKEIEKNLKLAVENYKKVYKAIEHKLNDFKKRNENQIILAQKIIEIYKSNIDNLNYQIISNAKNLLNFNQMKFRDFEGYNLKFILETNIMKEYPIENYINEKLEIKNIQKNLEIKNDNKLIIRDAVFINNQKKIIFNAGKNLLLFNNKNYSFEDKIEINEDILSINLIKEKEMILISFKNSIKKININNNKIKIEDFLNNIEISKPGIVIKYNDEYSWTNGKYIEFSFSPTFNLYSYFEEDFYDYETTYYFNVINLIQFFDDILFIISLKSEYQSFMQYNLMLCSYKNSLAKYNHITLEHFDFEYSNYNDLFIYEDMEKNYNIYISNYEEIIIFGKLGIYVINPF